MLEDAVEVGGKVPASHPAVRGSRQPYAGFSYELIVRLRWIFDPQVRLLRLEASPPYYGGKDVERVHRPML